MTSDTPFFDSHAGSAATITLLSMARPPVGSLLVVAMSLHDDQLNIGNIYDTMTGPGISEGASFFRNRGTAGVDDGYNGSVPPSWFPTNIAEDGFERGGTGPGRSMHYVLWIRQIDGSEPDPIEWFLDYPDVSFVRWCGIATVDDTFADNFRTTGTLLGIRAGTDGGGITVPSVAAPANGSRLWTYICRADGGTNLPTSPPHGQSLAASVTAIESWSRYDWDPFPAGPTGDVLAPSVTNRWVGYNVLSMGSSGWTVGRIGWSS